MKRQSAVLHPMSPRTLILKNGQRAIIRPARLEDAQRAWECNRAVVAAGVGVTRSIAECDKSPQKVEADFHEWIDGVHSGPGGCMLLAEIGEIVAAAGVIRRMQPSRLRHVAHIGLGVHPKHQGLGLGRALMEGLIGWARTAPGPPIARVDLYVFADNARAIALYRSLGFVEEGRRVGYIRYEDGRFTDDVMMALRI